ncbi:MAG: fused MFS/spermidine synthase [Sutterellaceae bacterium]|nr:fused MFS/spermidine synthase [Burkholderiaceae bacterium]MCX7900860.1 fused MFS/spermidine synthase [Burkholderiaceae bacterium]MDW8429290.1 fused MFS/spermidine synthase [Sutterellaceae bacterium]
MALVAVTIFLSAFLLFLVQPIVAKQILPWFGGTSAVWTTCMVFFQVLLLAGYAYAHSVTRRLHGAAQARLHIALLAISLAFLPIVARESLAPAGDEDAALAIIALLTATVGLPYFLLSSTGPLLQRWVAHRFPQKTVYRLFALSNLGSLLGLLAFPFAIEPLADSRTQAYLWSAAYAAFVLASAALAWQARCAPAPDVRLITADAAAAMEPPPRLGDYLLWLALAALGSVLLLAATAHITQNIASVPFLWVLPLALYLLSFVLAFEGRGGRGLYDPRWGIYVALAFAVAMAAGLSASRGVLDVTLAIPLYSAGMFFGCLFCHGELAGRKPAPRYLTHFYLTVSAGGALGGLFVGLVAPRIFPAYYELPLALFALCALALWAAWTDRRLVGPWVVGIALTAAVATTATAYYGWQYVQFLRSDVIVMQRNFYGTLRVREQGSGERQIRRLLHGVILHGEQPTTGPERYEPGSYYARSSGIGLAIEAQQARGPVRIGVVGLGVGTIAAYGREGDVLRFYELDPDVLQIAQRDFGYLSHTRARLEFALGDGRLSLTRELRAGQRQRFDVLAIDAFSSDAIPVHLLTREAVALYRQHLAPDGILAVHISNRFLDLQPVLANIAAALGMAAVHVADSPSEESGASSTDWVLLAEDAATLARPPLAARAEPLAPRPELSLWTDRFNNLLDVLKTTPWHALRSLLIPE